MPMSGRMPTGGMAGNPFGTGVGMMPGSGMMPPSGFMNPAMGGFVEDFSTRMPASMGRMPATVYDPMPFIPGEVVVGERIDEPRLVGFQHAGMEWAQAVKPYVTMDKYVEVPQTIIKEGVRHVPKPEIVERIIEVPKMSYNERTVMAEKKYQDVERVLEVPARPIIEHRPPLHIPRTEIQERLIEIPKIEYRERIEYEDRIEYREVPVDKIVEVPQIEYVQREVERFVPQNYVREYDVPRYTEVPVQQIQEVERTEFVPVINPIPRYHSMPVPVNVPVSAAPPSIGAPVPMGGTMGRMSGFGSSPFGPMGTANAYANYDPMTAGMTGSFRGPPTMGGMPGMPMSGGSFRPGTMGGMPMSGMMGGMPMPGMMNSVPGIPPMPGSSRMDPFASRPIPAY